MGKLRDLSQMINYTLISDFTLSEKSIAQYLSENKNAKEYEREIHYYILALMFNVYS